MKYLSANRLFFSIIFCFSIYFLIFKIPFPWTDDLAYKIAGYNLFQGLGFAAPSLVGLNPGIEKLFVLYPPLYPFLFGLWFWIFGFSITSSLTLSFLICGLVAYLLLRLFQGALGSPLPKSTYGLVFLGWVFALSGIDRPDTFYVLLGLSVFAAIEIGFTKYPAWLVNLLITFLIGFSVASSPVMGIMMLLVFFFSYLRVRCFTWKSILMFVLMSACGIILTLGIWSLTFIQNPMLFQSQFLTEIMNSSAREMTINNFLSGFRFMLTHGFLALYLPIIIFMFLVTIAEFLRNQSLHWKKRIPWEFFALLCIWFFLIVKAQYRYPYLTMCHIFFLYFTGIAFIKFVRSIKGLKYRQSLHYILVGGILLAGLPFLKTALLPLTWSQKDFYGYNGNRILEQIPEGSKVLTPPRFWYLFNSKYKIYDSYFSHASVYHADYVLLASGGSGAPGKAWLPFVEQNERQYFEENFIIRDSTLIEEPNRLFGFKIARSRWCYRFELYGRK